MGIAIATLWALALRSKTGKKMEEKIQHYIKAPITEAVIDLRVEMSFEGGLSSLNDFGHRIQAEYLKRSELVNVESQIQIKEGETSIAGNQTVFGYRYSSPDNKQIVQARLDGFSFSRLAPYEKWEIFRDEARRLWDLYQVTTNSTTVTRVAVRYINRLDLPLPLNNLKEYLLTAPEISHKLSQGLSDYFMQLEIPQEDIEATLVLIEALIPSSKDNFLSVLLDIDLFSHVDFASNDDKHWSLLETFRSRKNEIFEACITDKTRELLK
ncbi:MAG: TIGR04255 family protein [Nostoc sp. DedSLP03]|uniref:TIGR04255 family protein n=1 Tax=Nostoc sp. DedSLP03 TaxID=3075400 RepID=UPI002AD3AA0A|nr:TIGR04255 family protein [Nostoc sp. DedSLP03]MDZ7965370.1 TIGR04255 family protein [Nostoc sp. DedSLP03]